MRKEDPVIRFWRSVNQEGPVCPRLGRCWVWTKHLGRRNKGIIWVGGQPIYASRFSYEQFVGEIPEGMYVCHKCDNPHCVRPSHLFVGSQDDNMKDMKSKGRANRPTGETNGRAKLTDEAVNFIRSNYVARSPEFSQSRLAAMFNVSVITIQQVLYRKRWNHLD